MSDSLCDITPLCPHHGKQFDQIYREVDIRQALSRQ